MSHEIESPPPAPTRHWQPLSAIDRRVAGVLVEKAKTTPDQYPLTVNSLRNGANQKSNRFPSMTLEADQIEESLDRLRQLGVVVEVQDSGRALKYRHRMYEWLGIDKTELAIMTELLLRGAQTVGELRGRAARMEPIADMAVLKPLLDGLLAKELIVYLTPEGRGAVVTHNLYQPNELERLRQEYAHHVSSAAPPVRAESGNSARANADNSAALAAQLTQLRDEMAALHERVNAYEEQTKSLERDVDELKRQLGV